MDSQNISMAAAIMVARVKSCWAGFVASDLDLMPNCDSADVLRLKERTGPLDRRGRRGRRPLLEIACIGDESGSLGEPDRLGCLRFYAPF